MVAYTTAPKICSRCDEPKPATPEYFHRNRTRPDGLYEMCKPCRRAEYDAKYRDKTLARMKQYRANFSPEKQQHEKERKAALYQANKERWRERERTWRQHNPERKLALDRAWRARHRERANESNRKWLAQHPDHSTQWRQQNPERAQAIRKAWNLRNPDAVRARVRNRRARLRGAGGTHTAADVKRQLEAQAGRCYWCTVPLNSKYHVDHFVPVARGGGNGPDNIVIACASCNQRRGANMPDEWDRQVS